MSKKSMWSRNKTRKMMSVKYFDKRQELKAIIKDKSVEWDKKMDAIQALNKLPKKSIPIRVVRRCALTGRARGVYRDFELCRITIRELAIKGYLPGVEQSSW